MTKKRSPLRQWEQEMLDAYCDHQWRLTLDPLYDKFQQWKAGKLSHNEMDDTFVSPVNPIRNLIGRYFAACPIKVTLSSSALKLRQPDSARWHARPGVPCPVTITRHTLSLHGGCGQ